VVLALPVLALALEHHGVLVLADLAGVLVLDLLDGVGGLDALILGESTLVSLSAGVGEEVRADGLDGAVLRGRDAGDGLEVLLSGPVAGERREGRGNLNGCHVDVCVEVLKRKGGGGSRSSLLFYSPRISSRWPVRNSKPSIGSGYCMC
jgi:hypothetical protein